MNKTNYWNTNIKEGYGVGVLFANLLNSVGIYTIGNLLTSDIEEIHNKTSFSKDILKKVICKNMAIYESLGGV